MIPFSSKTSHALSCMPQTFALVGTRLMLSHPSTPWADVSSLNVPDSIRSMSQTATQLIKLHILQPRDWCLGTSGPPQSLRSSLSGCDLPNLGIFATPVAHLKENPFSPFEVSELQWICCFYRRAAETIKKKKKKKKKHCQEWTKILLVVWQN